MSPRVRRQLAALSIMLVLTVVALLSQGSAGGPSRRTLARTVVSADCDLVTCPLRTSPAVARFAAEQCATCAARIGAPSEDEQQVHLAAVSDQSLDRPWRGRPSTPHGLDGRRLAYASDLHAFASSARDDSAPNRAPPSA